MRNNGSPKPVFDTDEQCTYFLTTLPSLRSNQVSNQVGYTNKSLTFSTIDDIIAYCNEAGNGVSVQVSNQVRDQVNSIVNSKIHNKVVAILETVKNYADSSKIFKHLGITNQTKNRRKYIEPLLKNQWIEMTNPKNSPKQQYIITKQGTRLLSLLKSGH